MTLCLTLLLHFVGTIRDSCLRQRGGKEVSEAETSFEHLRAVAVFLQCVEISAISHDIVATMAVISSPS